MPKPDKPSKPSKPYTDDKEPPRDPEAEGDIVNVHREYVERRLKGGAPATPQAYARAMAQWQKLPGAIGNLPATDLTQAQEAPTPTDVSRPTPASETRNKAQKS